MCIRDRVITEPRYLKLVTVSSCCPFILISVLMQLYYSSVCCLKKGRPPKFFARCFVPPIKATTFYQPFMHIDFFQNAGSQLCFRFFSRIQLKLLYIKCAPAGCITTIGTCALLCLCRRYIGIFLVRHSILNVYFPSKTFVKVSAWTN